MLASERRVVLIPSHQRIGIFLLIQTHQPTEQERSDVREAPAE
jgi:hypothetical protein